MRRVASLFVAATAGFVCPAVGSLAGAPDEPKAAPVQVPHNRIAHADEVECLAFSPDGKTIATGGRDEVRLWDSQTWKLIGPLNPGTKAATHGMAFSPDGKTLACAGDTGTIALWTSRPERLSPSSPVTTAGGSRQSRSPRTASNSRRAVRTGLCGSGT